MWSEGGEVSFGALGGGADGAGGAGTAGGPGAGIGGGAGLVGVAGLAGAGACCRITEISCDTVSLTASLAVIVI